MYGFSQDALVSKSGCIVASDKLHSNSAPSPLLDDFELVGNEIASEEYKTQNETIESPTWQKILEGARDIVTSEGFIIGAATVVGAAVGVAVAPKAANAMGFGKDGIAKKSLGASMMRANGAFTPKGGLVSTFQHVGATGSVLASPGATAVSLGVGAGVGAAAAALGLAAAKSYGESNDCIKNKRSYKNDDWELL